MSRGADSKVTDIVARFFESRRDGRRMSIDQVLDSFENVPDRQGARAAALRAIAEQARTRMLDAGSPGQVDAAEPAAGVSELPELEGYDVVDLLGRGGMGAVYEGYQQATGRRVAIKFMLDATAASGAGRRRFEREVELVARLQHPHIVSVLDSGIHSGRYFYVMEYVDGRPLDEALIPGECDVRDALRLVVMISTAVNYAHQRGVLHRDLKPSNVLIDERGQPRLLDFGLAKAIDPLSRCGVELTLSEPGQLIGTLGYMSPEQSRGQAELMSVRSDVYSLGAIGYELVTGRLPCTMDGALADVLQRISMEDPARPSVLRRGVDADVNAILLKALEKSPDDRYPTAGDLAADIRRHLEHKTIVARPARLPTRISRWARRNRAVATVGGLAVLAIVAITAAAFLQIMAERDQTAIERDRALEKFDEYLRAEAARNDPDTSRGIDPALREKLDRWEQELTASEAGPMMEAGMRHALGLIYFNHGEYRKAETHLDRTWTIRRALLGDDAAETVDSLFYLARTLHKRTKYADAERSHRTVLAQRLRRHGSVHPQVADSLSHLAWVVKDQGRFQEAEPLYREALEMRRELLKRSHKTGISDTAGEREAVADSLNKYAQFLWETGDYAGAEPLFREALDIRVKAHGESDPRVATSKANLGECLRTMGGAYEEAESLLREALALRRRLYGAEHPTTIVSMNLLGLCLRERGKYDQALPLFRQALRLRAKAHPDTHDWVAVSHYTLAAALQDVGEYEQAHSLYLGALERWRIHFKDQPRHPRIATGLQGLASVLLDTGELEQAARYCRDALAMRCETYGDDNLQSAHSRLLLGRILLDSGTPSAAEPELQAAASVFRRKYPRGHWRTALADSVLGECLVALGRYEDAEPLLVESWPAIRDVRGRADRYALRGLERIINLYEAWGRPERAAEFRAMLPATTETPRAPTP